MEQTLRVQEGLADLTSAVQENVSGIHVVKAYAAEEVAVQGFIERNRRFSEQSLELARVRGRLMPLMKLASGGGLLVVLSYGGHQVIRGTLSLGDLVAFIAYLNLLAWPTMAMGWMLSIVQRGRAAMQRLEQILSVEPAIAEPAGVSPLPEIRGRIEFEDVSFSYPGHNNGRPALEHVSFTLEAGQTLAVVGRTGSGKSSVVQLLPRLFDPSSGRILLDGHDLRSVPLAQLRSAIGFVPQDPFLFSTRVRDNIAFGLDGASEEEIRDAAEAAEVAGDIGTFPRGYDTIVGERGITLSGGQKQRLTLARALACEPPLLVLDDALSSVDTRTERGILRHLRERLAGRTCIMIAHRISTILDADRIAVMDDGRIVELGDHSTLLARGGLYAEMFRQQQLEEEIEEDFSGERHAELFEAVAES
jgi:ATP-binding cassette subfamily B protein